jgi:hypothetical protein
MGALYQVLEIILWFWLSSQLLLLEIWFQYQQFNTSSLLVSFKLAFSIFYLTQLFWFTPCLAVRRLPAFVDDFNKDIVLLLRRTAARVIVPKEQSC